MAEGSRTRWLTGCLGCLGLLALLCCCGGGIATWQMPAIFVALFTDDAPLPIQGVTPDPVRAAQVKAGVCGALAREGQTSIAAEDLALLALGEGNRDISALRMDPSGEGLLFQAAFDTQGKGYVNVIFGGSFALERGWFTDVRIDHANLSSWDLAPYMRGQQLAQNANQSLANQKSQDPSLQGELDRFEKVWTEGGTLHLKMAPGGLDGWRFCAPQG